MLLTLSLALISMAVIGYLIRILIVDKLQIEKVEDRVVLITGSAGGFGRKIVTKCLENKMTVFATCRTKESAEKMMDELKGMPGHLDAFQMDVSSENSIKEAKEYIVEQLKVMKKDHLYAIVNNAGIQCECFMDDFIPMQSYEEAVGVNTYGPIRVTKIFKDLLKQSKGRLVFCTSCVNRFPPTGMGPYTVSKWGLEGFIEVIRHELLYYGVDVINIQPGIFCTPMNTITKMMGSMNAIWSRADQKLREEYGEYWFSKVKRVFIDLRDASPTDCSPVANAYFHAITAKYPYKNYVVGLDAKVLYQPFSWFPTRLQEYLMMFLERIYGVPKPAAVDQ